MITPDLKVFYLSNIIKLLCLDGKPHPRAEDALGRVCQRLDADLSLLKTAASRVSQNGHTLMPVGRFSDRVRNLEDMLYVSLVDGQLSPGEKEEVQGFIQRIGLTPEQTQRILTETKMKIDLQLTACECCHCGKTLTPASKFCTDCGTPLPGPG